jgi:hypothetical protein
VRIEGKDHYFGKYGTEVSREKYHRLVAEWLAAGRRQPDRTESVTAPGISVSEMILAYWRHAENHYCYPGGMPTKELDNLRDACTP